MNLEALCHVLCPDRAGWIGGHHWRRRHVGQRPAIGPPKLKGPVSPTFEPIALVVHGAMMPATKERQIR
jgi:hypothetical protein